MYATPDVGDAVAAVLLTDHFRTAHGGNAAGAAAAQAGNVKKPDRPAMKEEATDQEWVTFEFEWDQYKKAAGIAADNDKIRSELLYSCDSTLRARLLEMVGKDTLDTINDADTKCIDCHKKDWNNGIYIYFLELFFYHSGF